MLDSGLGIRGNWLNFHAGTNRRATLRLDGATSLNDAGGTSIGTPSAGSTANTSSSMDLTVVDLEITQKWVCGCWWLQVGGGARYASLRQTCNLSVVDAVNGNSSSAAEHAFTGFGPTISFEAHRKIFESNDYGVFGLYGTARGSLLFGSTTQNYTLTTANPFVAAAAASSTSTGIMPVGEMELGAEWSKNWSRARLRPGRAIGQFWGNAGTASSAWRSATLLPPPPRTLASSASLAESAWSIDGSPCPRLSSRNPAACGSRVFLFERPLSQEDLLSCSNRFGIGFGSLWFVRKERAMNMKRITLTLSTVIVLSFFNLPAQAQYAAASTVRRLPQGLVGSRSVHPGIPVCDGAAIRAAAPLSHGADDSLSERWQPTSPNLNDGPGPERSGWSAGIGVYYIEPFFQSNPAYINGHTAANGNSVYHQTEFSQQISFAPLAWVGYTWANGWGIRGRWFEFSGSGQASTAVGNLGLSTPGGVSSFTTTGDPVNAYSVLYTDVVDLEATYTFFADRWSLTASAGVRYVHLNQSYTMNKLRSVRQLERLFDQQLRRRRPDAGHRGAPSAWTVAFRPLWFGPRLPRLRRGTSVVHHRPGRQRAPRTGRPSVDGAVDRRDRNGGRVVAPNQPFPYAGGRYGRWWGGAGNASQALSGYYSIVPGSNFGFNGGVLRAGIDF